MSGIFLKILNMSIAAGVVVLVVVLTRALLRRAPKWLRCALWVLVAVRLVVPVLPQSSVSLVPSAEPIVVKQAEQSATEPAGQSAASPADRSATDPSGQTGVAPNTSNFNDFGVATDNQSQPIEHPAAEDRSKLSFLDVAGYIWLGGLVVMAAYAAASYTKLRRKVSASVSKTSDSGHGRTFICDDIASPFILGVFKPRIYLPSGLSAADEAHVLAHEDAHLLRRDQFWKPLGFLLLSVYWFNPLMWLAYILFCRDIELACDEKVVKDLTEQDRAAYSRALLSCSISRSAITACPLAFGEVDVKSRVKSALSYKKPAFWVIVVAVVICIVLAVCFLTNPKEEKAVQGKVTNWFENDTYGEGMGPVVTLEEYPGMEFRAEGNSVYVIKDGKDEILTKYPAKNAFFCDLDGDGKREICTTCLLGSGIVDSRVVVYVLSDGSTLELSDRGKFDYTLAMRDGKLIVMKRAYDETSSVGADGLLVLRDGRLEMAKLDGELIKSPSSPPELTVVSDQGSTEVKHSGSAWQKGSSIGAGISITTEDSPGLGNDTFRKGLQVVTTENGKISLSFGSDPDSVTAEFIDETVLMQMGESSAVEVGIAGDRSFNAPRGENYCIVHAKWEVRSGTGGDARYYFKVVNNYKESRTIIEDLQNLYPGYFTLDVRDGLTVYGSSDSGFGFLPGWNSDLNKYSYESRQQLRPMQLSEAKQIISWYKTNKGLEDSMIILKPFQDPASAIKESASFPETLAAMFDERYKTGDWLEIVDSSFHPNSSDFLTIDLHHYYMLQSQTQTLPQAYKLAGTLSAVQAGSTGLEGAPYYTMHLSPAVYVYMERTICRQQDIDSKTTIYTSETAYYYVPWVMMDDAICSGEKAMIVNDVLYLSRLQGADLTWADLEEFYSIMPYSGRYCRHYFIDGTSFRLDVEGKPAQEGASGGKILSARLIDMNFDESVDFLNGDVSGFVEKHK